MPFLVMLVWLFGVPHLIPDSWGPDWFFVAWYASLLFFVPAAIIAHR